MDRNLRMIVEGRDYNGWPGFEVLMNLHKQIVLPSLLLIAVFANAVTKQTGRITVLESQAEWVILDDSGVPRNCDAVNFDAYCHNSKTTQLTNTLLVQEGEQPPFRIACTVDTKWSRCVQLPTGRSFEYTREKRGVVVYYEDVKGKVRKHLYSLIAADGSEALAATPMPVAVSAAENNARAPIKASVSPGDTVKCIFRSIPSGAEVALDGRYIGSTPSVVNIQPGSHAVLVALPGFAEWKRNLTVSAESAVTVNAILKTEK